MDNLDKVTLASKLWDTFRSRSYYRSECRKTYDQLGIPLQNLWLAVADTACQEISRASRLRAEKSQKSSK